jgi:hypothetical protein
MIYMEILPLRKIKAAIAAVHGCSHSYAQNGFKRDTQQATRTTVLHFGFAVGTFIDNN